MSIDSLEEHVEKILLGIGITSAEISGLILIIVCVVAAYAFIWYSVLSIKCRKISCDRIDKTISNQERAEKAFSKVREDIAELKENERSSHTALLNDTNRFHEILRDVDKSISQLHGIMLGNTSVSISRREITHDEQK